MSTPLSILKKGKTTQDFFQTPRMSTSLIAPRGSTLTPSNFKIVETLPTEETDLKSELLPDFAKTFSAMSSLRKLKKKATFYCF